MTVYEGENYLQKKTESENYSYRKRNIHVYIYYIQICRVGTLLFRAYGMGQYQCKMHYNIKTLIQYNVLSLCLYFCLTVVSHASLSNTLKIK